MNYVRFDELEFNTPEQQTMARELYKLIESSMMDIVESEELIYNMVDKIGKERAFAIAGPLMNAKYALIQAMKTTFWTMTRINAECILMNLSEDEEKSLYKTPISVLYNTRQDDAGERTQTPTD